MVAQGKGGRGQTEARRSLTGQLQRQMRTSRDALTAQQMRKRGGSLHASKQGAHVALLLLWGGNLPNLSIAWMGAVAAGQQAFLSKSQLPLAESSPAIP